jgi:hypothetical protein
MHLQVPHKTSQSEALTRVKQGLNETRSQLGDKAEIHEERWDGNTLHFDATAQGQRISGTLEVTDKDYIIDATLPLMLKLFEGRIEREIMEKVKELG